MATSPAPSFATSMFYLDLYRRTARALEKEREKVHRLEEALARPFVCPQCGKAFESRVQLRGHENKVHIEALYGRFDVVINNNNNNNSSNKKKKKHRKYGEEELVFTNNNKTPQPVDCPDCSRTFTSKAYLVLHTRACHPASLVGKHLRIHWPELGAWYAARVTHALPDGQQFGVLYTSNLESRVEYLLGPYARKWDALDDEAPEEQEPVVSVDG
jgi:hypothetical protein